MLHSMDKYLMLVRKVVRQYLVYCQRKAVCEEDMDQCVVLPQFPPVQYRVCMVSAVSCT